MDVFDEARPRLTRPVVDAGLRLLRWYWRLVAPFRVGVRGIVCARDGRIVLVRHGYGDRLLHLPGGGVRRREHVADGLRRELTEELGIDLTIATSELRLLGAYSNLWEGKSDHVVVFVVEPGQWSGDVHAAAGTEIERVVTVDARSLPDDLSPGTRRRLEELLGSRDIDFVW